LYFMQSGNAIKAILTIKRVKKINNG